MTADFSIRKTQKANKGLNEEYLPGSTFTLRGPNAAKVFAETYEPQGFTKTDEPPVKREALVEEKKTAPKPEQMSLPTKEK